MSARKDPLIGTVLNDRYRIDAKIARGGMAMVYRGTDLRLDREIAIKVMHEHLIGDETFVERFRREAINAGRLTHPNLVAIHDQARDGDTVYLVMEYLPSVTLRRELKHRATFTPRQAIVVLDAILAALEAVHSTGIIHRDLKPDNVLLGTDGQVKLADFGLARAVTTATTTKTLIGTVGYVAPELVTRTGADARTDLYTVGIMFYEMLTGMQPYTDDVPIQVAYRHVHDSVPPPSEQVTGLSPLLDALVLWATSKDPEDRPDDASQFRNALAEAHAEMNESELDFGDPDAEPGKHSSALTASIALGADAPKEKRSRTDEIPYLDDDDEEEAAEEESGTAEETDVVDDDTDDGAAAAGAGAGVGPNSDHDTDDGQDHDEGDEKHSHDDKSATAAAAGAASASSAPVRRRRRRLATTIGAGLLVLVLIAWLVIANLPAPTSIVPAELAGKDLDEVTSQIEETGLETQPKKVYDDSVPAGTVIGTQPVGGSELAPDSTVTVVVSKGEEMFEVPKLEGLNTEDAEAALKKADLAVGKVDEQYSDSVDQDVVISASKKSGEELSKDSEVDLVVSRGEKPIPVPNVEGLTFDAAYATLAKRGFRVGKDEVFSDDVPKGKIVSQWPTSSKSKPDNSLIIVRVSKGEEKKDEDNDDKKDEKKKDDGKDSKKDEDKKKDD
ncbi:Stk1 family PASTA domain-containing Ser/Thr kinase [Brevibacterium marinum]|uniref:non-specific serine/threonine protein kinase n=1 Tax=Brevibacterium marinum TaxID=418643 RepID=A0A846S114_9MICO|nr:Stk1 family PASTA domain-containing Ser/Thr kinase [Brevibacterium marinum]NJC57150.1 serine/threonine-protein kinase [Brevibacterium marinum]